MPNPAVNSAVKGQVSLETILGFSIILLFFAAVLFFSYTRNELSKGLKESVSAETECNRIALRLSQVYSGGSGSKWTGKLDANVFFGTNFLDINHAFGKSFCLHYADLNNPGVVFFDGNIVSFWNSKGKIVVKNV